MSTKRGPVFAFSLPGGRLAPLSPRQLRHWSQVIGTHDSDYVSKKFEKWNKQNKCSGFPHKQSFCIFQMAKLHLRMKSTTTCKYSDSTA